MPQHLDHYTIQATKVDIKFQELHKWIKALQGQTQPQNSQPDFNARASFTKRIINELIPPRFKMPQLESYDGTTDLIDHLESFMALMLLHSALMESSTGYFHPPFRKRPDTSIQAFIRASQVFVMPFITTKDNTVAQTHSSTSRKRKVSLLESM